MTWITLKNYFDHEVPCPDCGGEDTERYVLTDEAGTENYVMDRHLECGWEKIYMPELLGLVEGRKMNWKDRFYTFTDNVKKKLKAENMNTYEILGRAVVYAVSFASMVVFSGIMVVGIATVTENDYGGNYWFAFGLLMTSLLGLYIFYRIYKKLDS